MAWRNCATRWKSTQHSLFSISAVRLRLVYLVATATNVSCLEHRKSIPVRRREGYKWHAENQLDAEIVIPWRLVFLISFISITNNHWIGNGQTSKLVMMAQNDSQNHSAPTRRSKIFILVVCLQTSTTFRCGVVTTSTFYASDNEISDEAVSALRSLSKQLHVWME